MSTNKGSFKNINSPNTTCPGCMENHKNRFAHIVPGGCMFKLESSLESGVERVQDSDTDDNTDKEDDTTDEEYEEYDKNNSNQATLSTYSYCVDIIKSSQHKKDKYIKEELFFDMDDIEINTHVSTIEYNNYYNDI